MFSVAGMGGDADGRIMDGEACGTDARDAPAMSMSPCWRPLLRGMPQLEQLVVMAAFNDAQYSHRVKADMM